MRAKQIPSASEFVVRGAAPRGAEKLDDDSHLVHAAGAASATLAAARAAWDRVRREAGKGVVVLPVLLDSRGERHLPTGEVTVRFDATPDDDTLHTFARAHALRLRSRNEFAEQQAVFEPADPTADYLPDVVAALARDPAVHSAWANTRTRYERK